MKTCIKEKKCQNCGKMYMRKKDQHGRLQGLKNFLKSEYCCKSCASAGSKRKQDRKARIAKAALEAAQARQLNAMNAFLGMKL